MRPGDVRVISIFNVVLAFDFTSYCIVCSPGMSHAPESNSRLECPF
jgi:hypothetical protein